MELLVKAKFFLKILTCQTYLTFNVSMKTVNKLCVFDRVYTLFKNTFLLFPTALLKCFIYSRVGTLDSPWCNNSCRTYQELGQGDFYSFDQEKVPFLLICLLSTQKKCNHKKNHTYFNLVYSICHRVDIYKLVKLLTSSFCYLLLFLVSNPPLTTTLRFPHSSSLNISLGNSIKFPAPSILIPSSSSSTVTTLFEGIHLQWKHE